VARAPPRSATCTATRVLIPRALGLRSKARLLPSPLHHSRHVLSALPPAIHLYSMNQAPLLGAAAVASCTSLSSSAGGSLTKLATAQTRPDTTPPRHFPPTDRPTGKESTVLVRFHPPTAPNWNPLGLGSVPDPFPTGRRSSASQILPGIVGAEEVEKHHLFFVSIGRHALWARWHCR
jgi:hypothetical protein